MNKSSAREDKLAEARSFIKRLAANDYDSGFLDSLRLERETREHGISFSELGLGPDGPDNWMAIHLKIEKKNIIKLGNTFADRLKNKLSEQPPVIFDDRDFNMINMVSQLIERQYLSLAETPQANCKLTYTEYYELLKCLQKR